MARWGKTDSVPNSFLTMNNDYETRILEPKRGVVTGLQHTEMIKENGNTKNFRRTQHLIFTHFSCNSFSAHCTISNHENWAESATSTRKKERVPSKKSRSSQRFTNFISQSLVIRRTPSCLADPNSSLFLRELHATVRKREAEENSTDNDHGTIPSDFGREDETEHLEIYANFLVNGYPDCSRSLLRL
jgi:hypothetical protein